MSVKQPRQAALKPRILMVYIHPGGKRAKSPSSFIPRRLARKVEDPLDQIDESGVDAPREIGPALSDDGRSQTSQAGDGGSGNEAGSSEHRHEAEVLYLERRVPLRDSVMWKLQRQYYTAHHVQCWEKMVVPCFVTSNSFIARAYARVLIAFMRDWFLFSGQADDSEPLLILEIGSGHGKFAHLVLHHLLEMREFLPSLPPATSPWQKGGACDGLPFRYVVTDVAQGSLDFVRSHSAMQEYVDSGLLEVFFGDDVVVVPFETPHKAGVAIFDAEEAHPSNELRLQVSGETVNLATIKNPTAAVCNYVFDSLQQDAFRVKNNTLYENRVSITAAWSLPDDMSQLALNALQGLRLQWFHRDNAITPERAKAFYAGIETTSQSAPTEAEKTEGAPESSDETTASDEDVEGVSAGGASAAHPASAGDNEKVGSAEAAPDNHVEATASNGSPETSPFSTEPVPDSARRSSRQIGSQRSQTTTARGDGRDGVREGRATSSSASVGDHSGDSDFDSVLASYVDGSFGESGGSLLMPIGGLRLLRRLSSLSGGRNLVLVGDKGYVTEEEMSGQRDPHIAYHGSLSCMVNMDALAKYARQRGGWCLASPYMEGFKCQALAFGMEEGSLQETRCAFEDCTQVFGPESFSTLQRAVKDEVAQPSLPLVVQLLRLSVLDPDVFMKFRATLVEQVSRQELSPSVWTDVKADVLAIADRWYPLQQGKDVNFEAARLLMALKDFESALVLFARSERVVGEHHVTHHNMGMCYFYLGKMNEAKEHFESSLGLNEGYEDSVQWLTHVRRSMVPPSHGAAPRDPAQDSTAAVLAKARLPERHQPVADDAPPANGTGDLNLHALAV